METGRRRIVYIARGFSQHFAAKARAGPRADPRLADDVRTGGDRLLADMAGGIYLIKSDGSLVEMAEEPYQTEDLLQRLLAQYPNVLAGEGLGQEPRRWLLIARE